MSDKPDGTPDDAGTTPADGGTPGGTPDGVGGDDKGKLIASLQEKASRFNEVEAENSALKKQIEDLRQGPETPPTTGSDDDRYKRLQSTHRKLEAAAEAGDEGAAYMLEINRMLYEDIRGIKRDRAWLDIPENQREGAKKYFDSGDYRTPEAARKAWFGDLPDEAREALKGKPSRKRPDPEPDREEVVDTASRPLAPAGVAQRAMTPAKWTEEWDKAERAGDENRLRELQRTSVTRK